MQYWQATKRSIRLDRVGGKPGTHQFRGRGLELHMAVPVAFLFEDHVVEALVDFLVIGTRRCARQRDAGHEQNFFP
ncbi:hypothetical protein D3C84_1150780 [compost metagenome]